MNSDCLARSFWSAIRTNGRCFTTKSSFIEGPSASSRSGAVVDEAPSSSAEHASLLRNTISEMQHSESSNSYVDEIQQSQSTGTALNLTKNLPPLEDAASGDIEQHLPTFNEYHAMLSEGNAQYPSKAADISTKHGRLHSSSVDPGHSKSEVRQQQFFPRDNSKEETVGVSVPPTSLENRSVDQSHNLKISRHVDASENIKTIPESDSIERSDEAGEKRNIENDSVGLSSRSNANTKSLPNSPIEDTTKDNPEVPVTLRRNVAAVGCFAKLLESSKGMKNPEAILNENNDEYMNVPCSSEKWFVIEVCEPVQLREIELANYELFSSRVKTFRVYASERYPTKTWELAGTFVARDVKGRQMFYLKSDKMIKYVRFELLDHYGSEHYCPLTMVRLFGRVSDDELEVDMDDLPPQRSVGLHALPPDPVNLQLSLEPLLYKEAENDSTQRDSGVTIADSKSPITPQPDNPSTDVSDFPIEPPLDAPAAMYVRSQEDQWSSSVGSIDIDIIAAHIRNPLYHPDTKGRYDKGVFQIEEDGSSSIDSKHVSTVHQEITTDETSSSSPFDVPTTDSPQELSNTKPPVSTETRKSELLSNMSRLPDTTHTALVTPSGRQVPDVTPRHDQNYAHRQNWKYDSMFTRVITFLLNIFHSAVSMVTNSAEKLTENSCDLSFIHLCPYHASVTDALLFYHSVSSPSSEFPPSLKTVDLPKDKLRLISILVTCLERMNKCVRLSNARRNNSFTLAYGTIIIPSNIHRCATMFCRKASVLLNIPFFSGYQQCQSSSAHMEYDYSIFQLFTVYQDRAKFQRFSVGRGDTCAKERSVDFWSNRDNVTHSNSPFPWKGKMCPRLPDFLLRSPERSTSGETKQIHAVNMDHRLNAPPFVNSRHRNISYSPPSSDNGLKEDIVVPATPASSRKDTAFMRLINRVRILERNVSVSMRYLEELSQSYRRQMERLSRSFNLTVAWLKVTAQGAEERDQMQQTRINELELRLNDLLMRLSSGSNESDVQNEVFPLPSLTNKQDAIISVDVPAPSLPNFDAPPDWNPALTTYEVWPYLDADWADADSIVETEDDCLLHSGRTAKSGSNVVEAMFESPQWWSHVSGIIDELNHWKTIICSLLSSKSISKWLADSWWWISRWLRAHSTIVSMIYMALIHLSFALVSHLLVYLTWLRPKYSKLFDSGCSSYPATIFHQPTPIYRPIEYKSSRKKTMVTTNSRRINHRDSVARTNLNGDVTGHTVTSGQQQQQIIPCVSHTNESETLNSTTTSGTDLPLSQKTLSNQPSMMNKVEISATMTFGQSSEKPPIPFLHHAHTSSDQNVGHWLDNLTTSFDILPTNGSIVAVNPHAPPKWGTLYSPKCRPGSTDPHPQPTRRNSVNVFDDPPNPAQCSTVLLASSSSRFVRMNGTSGTLSKAARKRRNRRERAKVTLPVVRYGTHKF